MIFENDITITDFEMKFIRLGDEDFIFNGAIYTINKINKLSTRIAVSDQIFSADVMSSSPTINFHFDDSNRPLLKANEHYPDQRYLLERFL